MRSPARPVVAVEAAPGLLAVAAEPGQQVRNAVEARVVGPARPLPADLEADVEPGQVADRIRPHRHAEVLHGLVDRFGLRAFEHHQLLLAAVGVKHAVADETEGIADRNRDLADALRDCDCRGQRLGR